MNNNEAMIGGVSAASCRGLVLPYSPVWDKGMAVFEARTFGLGGRPLEGLLLRTFAGGPAGDRPSAELLAEWRAQGLGRIDVRPDKYQDRKFGSACEVVLSDLGLIPRRLHWLFDATRIWLSRNPEAKKLARKGAIICHGREVNAHEIVQREVKNVQGRVALEYVLYANRNNGSGFLKDRKKQAFAWLLRELEKGIIATAEERREEQLNDWGRDELLGLMDEVIEADFRVRTAVAAGTLRLPSRQETIETLAPIWREHDLGDHFTIFTVGGWLRNLLALGTGTDGIIDAFNRIYATVVYPVEHQLERARECLAAATVVPCGPQGREEEAVIVTAEDPAVADNTRLAALLFEERPGLKVLVSVNSRRQVSILARREVPILHHVHRPLEQREKALWHYDGRFNKTANGGHSFPKMPPTAIPLREIISLVERAVRDTKADMR